MYFLLLLQVSQRFKTGFVVQGHICTFIIKLFASIFALALLDGFIYLSCFPISLVSSGYLS